MVLELGILNIGLTGYASMKLHVTFMIAACVAVTLWSSVNTSAQDDLSLGETLAIDVCSTCHAVQSGDLTSPNPDAPSFEQIANTPGMTRISIRAFLQSPHQTMPLLVLDAAEIDGVSAYILSLKRNSP